MMKISHFPRVVLFLLLLFQPVLKGQSEGFPLRIATFNTQWLTATAGSSDKDPWGDEPEAHLQDIAGVIEALNPDIINLVEVVDLEAVEALKEALLQRGLTDYHYYWLDSYDTYTDQDLAVVTRYPLTTLSGQELHQFYSPNLEGPWRAPITGGKGSTSISKGLVYFLDIQGIRLGFLGLHLKANPGSKRANAQREAQADVAARILRSVIIPNGGIPVVLGDFNDYDPGFEDRQDDLSSKTSVLAKIRDFDRKQQGEELFNTGELIFPPDKRFTAHWDRNQNRIIDQGDKLTMIDHILLGKELMDKVIRVWIDHSFGPEVSDHWPVVVDLQL